MFEKFKDNLKNQLPKITEEIISQHTNDKVYAIGFVTTDDFYGMYISLYSEK